MPGTLSSPNYPNDFYNYLAISWLITAPPDQTVTINFVDFVVDVTSGYNAYVMLYDGDSHSDTQIGTFRYRPSPDCQVTSSNNLLVTFTSDHEIAERGFSAKFYFGGQYE